MKEGVIFFTSPQHRERFLAVMQDQGRLSVGALDPEYGAALYILTAHLSTWHKASGYVDDEGIDFEALLREIDFSAAYSVLIDLAWNLFNGGHHADPIEFLRLDEQNFRLAIAAIHLRRYTHRLEDM